METELIIKIVLILMFIFLSFFTFYKWGIQPVKFKDISVDQLNLYFSILLYRGYTDSKSNPDGRLYIYSESGDRYVMLKKYKVKGNQVGVYIFAPIYEEPDKDEIIKQLEKAEDKKPYWEDNLMEIDFPVVGIDIRMDMYWGVEFFKSITEIIFNKKSEDIKFSLYFKNINDDITELYDFDIDSIDLSKFDGNLMEPVTRAVRVAGRLGFYTRNIIRKILRFIIGIR